MEKLPNEREQQCLCTGGPALRWEPMVHDYREHSFPEIKRAGNKR